MTATSVWISCEDLLPEAKKIVEIKTHVDSTRAMRLWGTFWVTPDGTALGYRPNYWRQVQEVSA